MTRVGRDEAISKAVLHERLRAWVRDFPNDIVIGEAEFGQTAWLHVKDGDKTYRLNADTRRDGVLAYLALLDSIAWRTVANRNGRQNAVACGSNSEPIPHFYLYYLDG
jgi:hypothetical protein